MTEPGDKVLVLDNGIYGKGFADFVSIYGGRPELYTRDYQNTLDVKELEAFLADNHNYKYATVVHGDTPSGMLNDVSAICPLLKKYGILTVVDSVSASFGEPLNIDACQIDIMCGGSQKVVSAPPGLTFVVVSSDAKKAMTERKAPIASFYANLTTFAHYYEEKWFHIPCRSAISMVCGLLLTTLPMIPGFLHATPKSPQLPKGHYRSRTEPLPAQRIFQYSYCF